MDLGPEEKFLKFCEVSRNRALKRFAQFFVQPAANGLKSTIAHKMCYFGRCLRNTGFHTI